ncbi:MAG TPA: phospholipase D-like domain-containing protein [Gemmatimonadaceae bacterium]|nr:phospholipase D-like domain-containing protein [Gemmatimonadaceae bacterium]
MIVIIGFVLGGLIIGLLTLTGLLSAVKGTPVNDVETPGAPYPPSVRDQGFREGMELVTRTPLAFGHRIEMFVNGDETYPRLWEDLRAARESITMQMYYCEKGRMAETLREVLLDRARAGVAVYLLYDAFGSSFPKEYIAALDDGGVHTAAFRPIGLRGAYKIQHRAHIRVVCVDGRVGYTGGFGISDKWFGDGVSKDQWRDSNVRFTGPAVRQLQAAFVACWAEQTGHMLVGPTLFPVDGKPGTDGALAGVLHGSPSVGSTEAERFFALSIASARERLYITNSYFVPDREFRAMIAGAAKRGVDTRVLTAGTETDVKSTLYAGRARYEELLEAGVRVYEYDQTMMHAKTLVVDGVWAAVGSMNADNRSLSFNEETVLLMLDPALGSQLERQFMRDLEHATEIGLESFRKRGMWERTKEHACHLVWRVL